MATTNAAVYVSSHGILCYAENILLIILSLTLVKFPTNEQKVAIFLHITRTDGKTKHDFETFK
jgi:EamA domain-containing membrane protein RarD